MVKVRRRNSNGKTVKQTVKNVEKSRVTTPRPAWVIGARMVPGVSSSRLRPDSDQSRISLWAKSEKVTVWSHEREQRFDTSNLFFNLWKTVMAWSYWAEACKTWRKWAKSVLPMVAMATGHRFSRNPPFNASKGCVKWSKGINYSWETLDFAGLQKNQEIRSQKTSFLAFLQAVAITYWNL